MSKEIMIRYWMEKAHEDLASARSNFLSDRSQNTVTPHHVESWLNGKDPALEPKAAEICGLHLAPPEKSLWCNDASVNAEIRRDLD